MNAKQQQRTRLVIGVAVFLALTAILVAGEMDPWAPPGPTMKQLDHIEPRIPLHAEMFPVTINAPGSYYLTGNVTASGGITIATDNVTIDLNGFTLAGTGAGPGIATQGPYLSVVIRNGTVRDWGASGIDVTRALIENVVADSNTGYGIWAGVGSVLRGCEAKYNGHAGLLVAQRSVIKDSTAHFNGSSFPEAGIVAGPSSVIESCTAHGNEGSGIRATDGSVVTDCATAWNSGSGIVGWDRTTITNSVAINNQEYGIQTGDDGLITKCVANFNVIAGMVAGAGSIIRDCAASDNGKGFQIGDGGIGEECTARANNGTGIHAGHGSTVRNCTIRENQSDGIYATYGVDVIGNSCTRNGSAVGGNGAGIYVEGVDNRIDGNLVLSNDRGIETALGQNTIVRNSASGNGDDYGAIAGGNDVGPIGTAATATSPWANIQF